MSVWRRRENLFLYYSVPGATETDAFGVARPAVPSEQQIIKASVKPTEEMAKLSEQIGPDISRVRVDGYFVDPKFQPNDFPLGKRIRAILKDLSTSLEFSGEFETAQIVPSRFVAVTKALGSPISGYFYSVGGG
ncbi:hypothetical protein Lepto7375DRAFT_0579 [Leptolyngbya sp. PCC 7375]|nr:hypothetical protein Lepto7375DRAFT_0579 [Leptolyngbya sp. PCC 7375]